MITIVIVKSCIYYSYDTFILLTYTSSDYDILDLHLIVNTNNIINSYYLHIGTMIT